MGKCISICMTFKGLQNFAEKDRVYKAQLLNLAVALTAWLPESFRQGFSAVYAEAFPPCSLNCRLV